MRISLVTLHNVHIRADMLRGTYVADMSFHHSWMHFPWGPGSLIKSLYLLFFHLAGLHRADNMFTIMFHIIIINSWINIKFTLVYFPYMNHPFSFQPLPTAGLFGIHIPNYMSWNKIDINNNSIIPIIINR